MNLFRTTRARLLAFTLAVSGIGGGIAVADNASVTIAASTARPASTTSYKFGPYTNYSWKGIRIFLKVSAETGTTGTLDCKTECQDPVSSAWVDMVGASFAQVTGVAQPTPLVIYPGLTAVSNKVTNDVLCRTWREECTVGGAGALTGTGMTFTIGGSLQQ